MKADLPVPIEDLPARVDVVPGPRVDGIEPADLGQNESPEGHVAARDVLGAIVGEEHVDRPPGRMRDHLGPRRLVVRRDVRAAGAADVGRIEAEGEVVRPLRGRIGVAVEVGDEVLGGCLEAGVASHRQPTVVDLHQTHPGVLPGDFSGSIGRAIVDHHNLEPWIFEFAGLAEALVECCSSIVRADDDADRGPVEVKAANRSPVPAARGLERGARRAVLARHSETPAGHLGSAHPPVVGPREDARASDASLDRRLQLPVDCLRLVALAVRTFPRGYPHLSEYQRSISSQVLQLREIAPEVLATLEEDVEHQKIEVLEGQVLGRGVVGVCDQPVGILLPDDIDQVTEGVGHDVDAMPTQHVSRDLVAQ